MYQIEGSENQKINNTSKNPEFSESPVGLGGGAKFKNVLSELPKQQEIVDNTIQKMSV